MNSVSFSGSYPGKINPVKQETKKRNIKKAAFIAAGAAVVAGGTALYAYKKPDKVQQFYTAVKNKVNVFVEKLKTKPDAKTGDTGKTALKELPDKIIDKAKENAKNLRLAGTSVAAGGAAALLVDNLAEENEEDKTLIIKFNNKKFKGRFENGKAYDENDNPFTGDLSIVYKDKDGTVKNTGIRYEEGILVKSFRYDSDKGELPVFMKKYKDGYIEKQYRDFVKPSDGSSALIPGKILCYNMEEESPFPMLSVEKTFSETGLELENKIYKRNLDAEGKIKGKPVHKWSVEYYTVNADGTKRKIFYPAKSQVFEGENTGDKMVLRQPVKIVDEKPSGKTEVTLMSREGYPLGKMILDKSGKVVQYRLIVEPEKGEYDGTLDGIIRLKDGKIAGMNDFMSVLESLRKVIAPPEPVVLDNPDLSEMKTREKNKAFAQKLSMMANSRCRLNEANNYNQDGIDRMLSSNYSTRKIGIRYNENGTVRAIALYSSFDDFPDCVTLFNDDGTPQKDINYDGYGTAQSFSPVYKVRGRA